MVSDPIELKTESLQNLAVNLYLPEDTVLSTYHNEDRRTYEQRGYLPTTEPTLVGAMLFGRRRLHGDASHANAGQRGSDLPAIS